MSQVTFAGNAMNLEGVLPAVGAASPDFALTANDLSSKKLSDYEGKVLVLVSVPSLDTPVCDLEVKRFNKEAAALSDKVAIVGFGTFSVPRPAGAVQQTLRQWKPSPTTVTAASAKLTAFT